MKAVFADQLASPEQKQLSDLVNAKGGVNVIRNNDKVLLDLEKAASKLSSSPTVEGHRMRQAQPGDGDLEVGILREDILEDPKAAEEKNWMVFSRKFEAQKIQIVDELTLVVQRETDRVIEELKGKAHEHIRDRVGFSLPAALFGYNDRLLFSIVDSWTLGRNGRCDGIFLLDA